jgi:hypothetical protein
MVHRDLKWQRLLMAGMRTDRSALPKIPATLQHDDRLPPAGLLPPGHEAAPGARARAGPAGRAGESVFVTAGCSTGQRRRGRSVVAIDLAPIAHVNKVDGENLFIDTQNDSIVSHSIRVNGNTK